jgi:RNA polymerase sigma factor (sigma-70 family)
MVELYIDGFKGEFMPNINSNISLDENQELILNKPVKNEKVYTSYDLYLKELNSFELLTSEETVEKFSNIEKNRTLIIQELLKIPITYKLILEKFYLEDGKVEVGVLSKSLPLFSEDEIVYFKDGEELESGKTSDCIEIFELISEIEIFVSDFKNNKFKYNDDLAKKIINYNLNYLTFVIDVIEKIVVFHKDILFLQGDLVNLLEYKNSIEKQNKIKELKFEFTSNYKGKGMLSLFDDKQKAKLIIKKISVIENLLGLNIKKFKSCYRIFSLLKKKNDNIKKILVVSNLRFVIHLAKKYNHRSLTNEDLTQEGNIGLIKAIDKFDYKRGFKLTTYASWWIKQAIGRAMSDTGSIIRIPVNLEEKIKKVYKLTNLYEQKYNRKPTHEEISEHLDIPVKKVIKILNVVDQPLSIDASNGNEENETSLIGLIESPEEYSPESIYITQDLKELMEKTITKILTERECLILSMRFGLNNYEQRTLDEAGKYFGITRERIRQIESKSLEKIKNSKFGKDLSIFFFKN